MRKLKWLGWTLGVVAAFAAAGAVAVRVLLPPEKVKALAVEKASAALGREVRLEAASAGLGGISLSGLEVSEVPDFKAGTALKAKSVTVSPEWWPLIVSRQVLIDKVSVSDFEASYAVPPPVKGSAASAPSGPSAPPPVLAVRQLALSGGKLSYKDGKGLEAVLTQAEAKASSVRPQGPVPLSVSFYFTVRSGGASHSGRVELKGTLDAAGGKLEKASLAFDPLSVTLDGIKAGAAGRVENFLAPRLDIQLQLPAVTRTAAPALAALPEGFTLPALSGPLKAALGEKGVDIQTLALKGDGAALSLRAKQTGTLWKVAEAKALWGAVSLDASGSADTGAKGGMALDFKARLAPMSLLEAARLVPGGAAYAASGTLSADLAAKGSAADPVLAGNVSLSSAAATVQGQRLAGVNARLALTPDSAAGSLKGLLNDAPFEAKLDAKGLRKAPQVKLEARLERLDLAALPSEKGAKEEVKDAGEKPASKAGGKAAPGKPFSAAGSLSIGAIKHANFSAESAALSFDVKSAGGSEPKNLDGAVTLTVGAGRFTDLKLLAADKPLAKALLIPVIALQKVAGLVKLPFFPSFDTVKFSSIKGDYVLKSGLLTVRESKLDGDVADAELSGSANLNTDALDMRAKVKVAGQTAVIKIGGTISEPKPTFDPVSILKQPVVEKAVDDLRRQGTELLKGLFKK
ncbi:MAG: hypothetical protein HYZ75_01660 [Elusimicrobia bacterium]|nr:hypothetical protein [Elusimicrobiota bacterium]